MQEKKRTMTTECAAEHANSTYLDLGHEKQYLSAHISATHCVTR